MVWSDKQCPLDDEHFFSKIENYLHSLFQQMGLAGLALDVAEMSWKGAPGLFHISSQDWGL